MTRDRRKRHRGDDVEEPSNNSKVPRRLPTPSFGDASATLTATTFGAQRLPEVKALWTHTQQRCRQQPLSPSLLTALRQTLSSGGQQVSTRHLRKRAKSHECRQRHRYPSSPGQIRTTTTSRRGRRKSIKKLRATHEQWRQMEDRTENDDKAPTTIEGSVIHWIPTHLWHVKRFHMQSLWGWKIPMQHVNRGAKAALRLVFQNQKCLVQDVSWRQQPLWCQIQIPCNSNGNNDTVTPLFSRIIPNFGMPMDLSSSQKVHYGMLHTMDSFPLQAIGPVSWLVTSHPLGHANNSNDNSIDTRTLFVYIWVHPCIRQSALASLQELVQPQQGDSPPNVKGPFDNVRGGLTWLQLRGQKVLEHVQKALLVTKSAEETLWRHILDGSSDEAFYGKYPHGSVLPLQLTSHNRIPQSSSKLVDPPSAAIWLVSHCPRHCTVAGNLAVCGIDVVVGMDTLGETTARQFFQSLVLAGACPIGLVEETHCQLECVPPLPVFPRDYPDTIAGRDYWVGSNENAETLRRFLEGGQGRLSLHNRPLIKVDWIALMEVPSASDNLAIVRGHLGQPFVEALIAACSIPTLAKASSTRRNRRSSKSASSLVTAPPIPKQDRTKLQDMCDSLIGFMSLPALVLCEFTIIGKGQASSGISLYAVGDSTSQALGHVLTASFSSARGEIHGFCACGAIRLLEAIAASPTDRSVLVCRGPDGTRQIRLKVLIGNHRSAPTYASIAMVFSQS